MLQIQTQRDRQHARYVKRPFETPDGPTLRGTWFDPVDPHQDITVVALAGTAHQSSCYEANPTWIETMTGAGIRVLHVDYRGHGESEREKPVSEWRLAEYIQDVQRALRAAGLRPSKTLLVGHSMGAGVALEVVADVPADEEPFAGVVALAGVAGDRWQGMYVRQMPGHFARHPKACWKAMRNPQAFFLNPRLARQLLFQPSTPQALVDRAIELTCPESGKALNDLCFALRTRPLRAKRALFVSGTRDGCVPSAEVFRSALDYQTLGGCRVNFRLVDGAPHNLMMDGPVGEVARLVVQEALACEEEQAV